MSSMEDAPVVRVRDLVYTYASKQASHHSDMICQEGLVRRTTLKIGVLDVYRGERVLVCGCNGAGKSTFLSILGGRKLVQSHCANILGRECFNDCSLGSKVCYLGEWWRSDFFLDISIRKFLGDQVCAKGRCSTLCDVLQVDLEWRISQLSDGQRRRCQILASLTASDDFELYILDEVTSDLDIVCQERLLGWLRRETQTMGATVLFATHIMDGMDEWASRIVYMGDGMVAKDSPVVTSINLYRQLREWMMAKYALGS